MVTGVPRVKKVPKAEAIELLREGWYIQHRRSVSTGVYFGEDYRIISPDKEREKRMLTVTFMALFRDKLIRRDPSVEAYERDQIYRATPAAQSKT